MEFAKCFCILAKGEICKTAICLSANEVAYGSGVCACSEIVDRGRKEKGNKDMANLITGLRMMFSIGLLFCPIPSTAFYALYLSAGFTDMIDGTVARITHTESEFGSKLDTMADFVFVTVCLVKLLPIFRLSAWQYAWIAVIAAIKVMNVIFGYVTQKKFTDVHSVMNKVTGGVLFVLPLTLSVIDPVFSVSAVCLIATFAAMQENYRIIEANKVFWGKESSFEMLGNILKGV